DLDFDTLTQGTIDLDFDTLTQSSLELEEINNQFAPSDLDFDTLTQGTMDLDFDTLTQSSLELEEINQQFAPSDLDFDTLTQGTMDLDFDTLTQSSLELEEINNQFAPSDSDFDTLTQGTIDLDFDTLTQSTISLDCINNSLENVNPDFGTLKQSTSDLDLDTLTQSILSLEDLSSSIETSDPDFDTLAQSTLDPEGESTQPTFIVEEISTDPIDVLNIKDELFDNPEPESIDQNIEADRHQLLTSIDELAKSESIADLPDLLDKLSDRSAEINSFIETAEIDRENKALLSKAEVDLLTKEAIDRLSTFATTAALEANAFTTASKPPSLATDRVELAITPSNPIVDSAPIDPAVPLVPTTTNLVTPVKRSVQIPVPLERLDKSAQQVVETLLTARAVTSISSQLQSQLAQLTTLTRENSQFVTRLRQLQDDYALLRNLSDEKQDSGTNVTLERYRQGYSTIVRLLENILRLSELGQEIESSTYQSTIRLDALDRSILQLKDGIEASRLVPFRNLTLRAKAILRDLTNRYGKPAELIVENEHIELDAGIVQQLEPALLHLLRNAYDHGLEPVQQRLDAGKSERGKIQISLHQQGNMYLLKIEDDGGGIDAERIGNLAKSKGFSLNQTSTNAELLAVLCQPGFSSSNTISEVSGRGVGMDVVVSQIESIGGRLILETFPGYG
ncbi:ATP-binding protein, partial [Chamaesiphon polymorphus]